MAAAKRVIVAGATDEIGRAVSARLLRDPSYALVVFSRDLQAARQKVPGAAEYVAWEPAEAGAWAAAMDGAYAVINMVGAPTFGVRWTPEYRALASSSSTRRSNRRPPTRCARPDSSHNARPLAATRSPSAGALAVSGSPSPRGARGPGGEDPRPTLRRSSARRPAPR